MLGKHDRTASFMCAALELKFVEERLLDRLAQVGNERVRVEKDVAAKEERLRTVTEELADHKSKAGVAQQRAMKVEAALCEAEASVKAKEESLQTLEVRAILNLCTGSIGFMCIALLQRD